MPLSQKIGILGGGQLGRMFIENAMRYGVSISILDPAANAPCANICDNFVQGSFKDYDTVVEFGRTVDILTIEIEHVNTDALFQLEKEGVQVIPSAKAIETIKDKGLQKAFYEKNEIPTAPFILTDDVTKVKENVAFLPAFQKTRKDGYDGKGVQYLANEMDLAKAMTPPSLLEKAVAIEKELSVIVVRNTKGETVTYPVVELVFDPVYNLVDYLFSPAAITEDQASTANALALKVANNLQSAGIFAVEMFLDKKGTILVNETAPRTHNSGHQTIEGSISSQFDNQLRALLNLPLGSTKSYPVSAMMNIVGSPNYEGKAKYEGINALAATENCYIHLYGKEITKPGRKMGHITLIGSSVDTIQKNIEQLKKEVKCIAE